MDELQALWNDYGKKSGFKDFNEFQNYLLNDKEVRQVFFDEINSDAGFKDYDEFESFIGLKKKEPTPVGQPGPVSSTPSKEVAPNSFGQLWEEKVANSKLETPSTSPTETPQPEFGDIQGALNAEEKAIEVKKAEDIENAKIGDAMVIPKIEGDEAFNRAARQTKVTRDFYNPAKNPEVKNLTKSEQEIALNQKLVNEGVYTPEEIALQNAQTQKDKQLKDEQIQKDDGMLIEDFIRKTNHNNVKTVYFEGQNYEHTPFYHLNGTDYAVIADGTKVKYDGKDWVRVTNEEADQIDNLQGDAQNEFKSHPQNITKNLFTGENEKQYIIDANKYLYDLKESNPIEYDNIAKKILLFRGEENSLGRIIGIKDEERSVKQDATKIQELKQAIIYGSQKYKLEKENDINILANRVGGLDKIKEYYSLKNGLNTVTDATQKELIQGEINKRFSPAEIADLDKIGELNTEVMDAKNKIQYANEKVIKDIYNKQSFQEAYNAAAKVEVSRYSQADAGRTVWNTSLGAANGVVQLFKRFDTDNSYGLLDLWSDSFNQTTQDLTAVTANRELINSKTGEWDGSAVLPLLAGGLTSMFTLGKGGAALGKLVGSYNAGVVASGFALQHNDYYEKAVASNLMTEPQANLFAIVAGGLTASLELLSPGEKIWGEGGLAHISLDEAMKRFAKGEELSTILNFKGLVKETASEVGQETTQDVGDRLAAGVSNAIIGKDALDTTYNLKQFTETAVITAATTLVAGGFKGLISKGKAREDIVNMLADNNAIDLTMKTIQDNVLAKNITQEKANELIQEITQRNEQINALPKEYSNAKKSAIIDLQNQLLPYQKNEYKVEGGNVVANEPTKADKQARADIQAKLDEAHSLSNDYYNTIALTEKQKADELAKGNPAVVTSVLETPELTPEQKAQQIIELENKAKEPTVTETTVGEVIDVPVMKDGKKGTIYQDGQTLVFKYAEGNREIELGNIDEIKDKGVSQFGLKQEERAVSFNDNNQLTVEGTPYVNNFSKPLEAINYDADGNILSVSLNTEDGKNRTFKGQIAEDIAYQLHLQEINKDNATTEEFINYINTNEEAQAEIDNAGVPEATAENTSEANAVIPAAKTEDEIAKLESERDATVADEAKPDVSFTWIPVKALAKNVSSSALQVRKETQDALKEKADTLKSLIDCLHGK